MIKIKILQQGNTESYFDLQQARPSSTMFILSLNFPFKTGLEIRILFLRHYLTPEWLYLLPFTEC